MPTSTIVYAVCTDNDGLYSKDYISIEVMPINEHDPILDKTHIDAKVHFLNIFLFENAIIFFHLYISCLLIVYIQFYMNT